MPDKTDGVLLNEMRREPQVADAGLRTLFRSLAEDFVRYEITPGEFLSHLQDRLQVHFEPTDSERSAAKDLLLAYACSRNVPGALSRFDSECSREFDAAAAKLRLKDDIQEDMRQSITQVLFVGVDGPPKILEYRGRGPLRHWYRVLVSRYILNELRRRRRESTTLDFEHRELNVAAEVDPELMLLKQTHYSTFKRAFQQALSRLRPDQRNALRCHYLMSMTLDQMAEAYAIHRATAARRLAQARDDLLQFTRESLRLELGEDTDAIDSAIRNAQGESSLSVARLLGHVESEQTASGSSRTNRPR